MTDLERQALLDAAASGPQSASVDGQSVSAHSLADLMKWDDRQRQLDARKKGGHGFHLAKIIPPGTT